MDEQCLKKCDNLWILFNGKEYIIGLTNKAQDDLGAITFATVPKVEQVFKKGDTLIEVEAEKAVSALDLPIGGIISSVNEKIDEDINVLNDLDELNAWIVSLKDVDPVEFANLQ